MPKRQLPSFRRRKLGAKLRRMRKQAHLTLKTAAPQLDKTPSSLHRVETGQTKANVHLVRSMMDLYNAFDPTLVDEVRAANQRSTPDTNTNHIATGSSTMPTDQSEVDKAASDPDAPESLNDDEESTTC